MIVRQFAGFARSKMPLKFAANLSWLFQDVEGLENRYQAAKKAGFSAVEFAFPYNVPLDKLVAAKQAADVEQVLINAWPGDLSKGDMGIAAIPHKQKEFEETLELAIKYAKGLDCKRIHVMAGLQHHFIDTAMEETYIDNIALAAEKFQKEGILALIEPINTRLTMPGYFLNKTEKAIEYIKKINNPNLKLQMDLFHVQIMDGNLTAMIKENLPYIGHIQIAQVPDRGEPNTAGEINYAYILKVLEESGYDGYVGLEYKPKGTTLDGLSWMKEMGCL